MPTHTQAHTQAHTHAQKTGVAIAYNAIVSSSPSWLRPQWPSQLNPPTAAPVLKTQFYQTRKSWQATDKPASEQTDGEAVSSITSAKGTSLYKLQAVCTKVSHLQLWTA